MGVIIQALADAVGVLDAENIISSSGFELKHPAPNIKAPFAVKNGKISGEVRLIAGAVAKRASYNWQKSMDNVRWTDLPSTLKADTTVKGLTEGSKVFFRYRAVTKEGEGGWSEGIYIIVI